MPSGGSSTHRSAPLVSTAEVSKRFPSVRITLELPTSVHKVSLEQSHAMLPYCLHLALLFPLTSGQWLRQRQYGSQKLCSRPRRGLAQGSSFQSQYPPKTDDVETQPASPLTSLRDNSEGHTSSRGVENPATIALKVTFFPHPIVPSSLSYRCPF